MEDTILYSYGCYDHDYPDFDKEEKEEFEWEFE